MANIIPLKDNTGAQFYPQTHEKAVVDSNGVNLQTKLQSITTPTYVTAWDGDSTPVVANIPSGVSVTYDGTTYTGTLAASASTANKTYLVSTGTTDNYNRYVTQLNGSTYSWQNIGSTEIDLSDYATKEELGQLDQDVNGYSDSASLATGSYVKPFTIIQGKKYRIKNTSSSGVATAYLANSNSTATTARVQTISSGGISAGVSVEFTAEVSVGYINGYANANVNISVEMVESLTERVDNLENGQDSMAADLSDVKKVTTGEKAQGTVTSSAQDVAAQVALPISQGDTISVSYTVVASDATLNIIALYGVTSNDTRVLLTQLSAPDKNGNLTILSDADYVGVRVYLQRATGFSGSAELSVTAKCYSKSVAETESSEYVNVIDCGADAGGTNDSREAFVDAIAKALVYHKNVYVPYGTYLISSPITIQTNEPLKIVGFAEEMSGSGRGTVIRASAYMSQMFYVSNSGAATKIIFENLMLDGNGRTNTAIVSARMGYFEMRRVFLINSSGDGLLADRVYYLKMKDCIASNCVKNGVHLLSQANVVRLEDCQFTSNASSSGFANLMLDMDETSLENKNCNVLISSCDLSTPTYNADGNFSVKMKNCLAVTLQNCYFENTDENEANENYLHVYADDSNDALTMFGNFIGMGSVSILAKSGAIFGNDFCTKAVYGEEDANALTLKTSSEIEVFGNHFWPGYTAEVEN